jgi:very-short-patch-repair endonuclease
MARKNSDARSLAAWQLARRQFGALTRRQLLALGFSPEAIDHRLESGRLRSLYRGVYAVGAPAPWSREQRWMAAILCCGMGAMLSHRSAAALWRIGTEGELIEITVPRRSEHRRPGLQVRGRPSLAEQDRARCRGIPVTAPARTLVDLATGLEESALERAINEADKRDLIHPDELRSSLRGFACEPGVRALRKLLDRHTFRLSDSQLEVSFRRLALEGGLPVPLTGQEIGGCAVDFHWPRLDLVVETDGLRYHRTAASQAADRRRDQALVAAGMTVLRFTHRQVRFEAEHVQAILVATVDRLTREREADRAPAKGFGTAPPRSPGQGVREARLREAPAKGFVRGDSASG